MRWYTVKQLAEASGISEACVRVWAERYHWPDFTRKENGQRLYNQAAVDDMRAFNAAGRPFGQIRHGVWMRPGDAKPPKPAMPLTPSDDLERRWIDAVHNGRMGIVAEYLASLGRMRPAVRAQYVACIREADRLTCGAFARLIERYGIGETTGSTT